MNRILISFIGASSMAAALATGCGDDASTSGGSSSGGSASGGSGQGGPSEGGAGEGGPPSTNPDAMTRAGVMIGSCIPDDGVMNTTASLYETQSWLGDFDVSCFEGAADACASVTACTGMTADNAGPCQPACLGETLEVCDDSWHLQVDCSKRGQFCSSQAVACVDEITGQTCDPSTYADSCDGDVVVECDGGAELRTDCSKHGLVCKEMEPGWAGCAGTGPTCDAAPTCDGDELIECIFGSQHRVTCSDIDPAFTCQDAFGIGFCGAAAECLPDPNATTLPEHCEGDSVVFCHAGKIEKVSCPSLGFSRCEELPNDTAICAPTGIVP